MVHNHSTRPHTNTILIQCRHAQYGSVLQTKTWYVPIPSLGLISICYNTPNMGWHALVQYCLVYSMHVYCKTVTWCLRVIPTNTSGNLNKSRVKTNVWDLYQHNRHDATQCNSITGRSNTAIYKKKKICHHYGISTY